ncbi:MAG TPA: hypothetical protein VGM54_14140 [Chthoniobacter sp.]|jgi:uncharacterized protein YecT (DUF1311 family)
MTDARQPGAEIIGKRKLSESLEDRENVLDDVEFGKAYAQLDDSLDEVGKEALNKQQVAWLKQRQELTDQDERKTFTALRVSCLRARLGKQAPRTIP